MLGGKGKIKKIVKNLVVNVQPVAALKPQSVIYCIGNHNIPFYSHTRNTYALEGQIRIILLIDFHLK